MNITNQHHLGLLGTLIITVRSGVLGLRSMRTCRCVFVNVFTYSYFLPALLHDRNCTFSLAQREDNAYPFAGFYSHLLPHLHSLLVSGAGVDSHSGSETL